MYVTDFDFFYNCIGKHPAFVEQLQVCSELEKQYNFWKTKIHDKVSLIEAMEDMSWQFFDGHTNIELPYEVDSRCLNIPCEWKYESDTMVRLFVTEDFQTLKKGDEILAIEDVLVAEIVRKMSTKIPHETIYLVMSRMVEYPYSNYHMFSERNLQWLFGKKGTYKITSRTSSGVCEKYCVPEIYNGCIDFVEDDNLNYFLEGNTVYFQLNSCVYDETYCKALDEISLLCEREKVDTLVLDLSHNMGGSSAVIPEFIRHVNINTFRNYEMIDYSKGYAEHVVSRQAEAVNQKSAHLFPQNIVCKVGFSTFSSARTFAVTLRDNGIAKLIGAPMGGAADSYGMPEKYVTPDTGIRFRVSRCLFLSPNGGKPDVHIGIS